MEFLAKDNEDHKVVFQYMNCLPLMLLLNHFYLIHLMEAMHYVENYIFSEDIGMILNNHLNICFLHNKPGKKHKIILML